MNDLSATQQQCFFKINFYLVCKVLDDKGLIGKPGLLEQRTDLQVAGELLQPALIRTLRELAGQHRWGVSSRSVSSRGNAEEVNQLW